MEREKAIEVIKEAMPTLWKETKDAIQTLIPELIEENDDEKIREELLQFFHQALKQRTTVVPKENYERWIAYLEKKKEQKPLPPVSAGARYYFDEWIQRQPTPKYWDAFLAGITFNKEEQKPAEWSEEDEAHRAFILESLEDQIRFCKKDAEGAYYTKQIRTAQNWLKSRRPQSHWKPSKEQMDALYNVEFKNFEKFGPILNSLYNDLKKL